MARSSFSGPLVTGPKKYEVLTSVSIAGNATGVGINAQGTVEVVKTYPFSYTASADTPFMILPAGSYLQGQIQVDIITTVDASIGSFNVGRTGKSTEFGTLTSIGVVGRQFINYPASAIVAMSTFCSVDTTLTYKVSTDTSGATKGSGYVSVFYTQMVKT